LDTAARAQSAKKPVGNRLSLSYTNLVGKFRCFSAVLGLTGEVSRGKLLSVKKRKKWRTFLEEKL
jgi:hypothetical protein